MPAENDKPEENEMAEEPMSLKIQSKIKMMTKMCMIKGIKFKVPNNICSHLLWSSCYHGQSLAESRRLCF